ncbi:MAG: MFS transporter [Pseudomonadota bacterium]|nr:MFS transporter [Pseudomonadota bacterium]
MPQLPAHVRHGYGIGALSFAIANTAMLFFLLKFLVDEVQLDPALAGSVLLVAKIWDAVIDPVIGRLVDRTGRPRAWIAGATVPLALVFATIWFGLPLSGVAAAVGYGALLVVYNTAYSAAVIPYGALTPALATDYDDRTRLNASRMGWSMVGGIVAGIAMPMLVKAGGFRLGGEVLALLLAPPLLVTWLATRGRVARRAVAASGSLAPPWAVLRSVSFRRVALLFVSAWASIAMLSALVPFYVQHHLHAPQLLDALFAAIQLSALVSIPAVAWLSGRVQKHRAYAVGMVTWAVVLLGLALVPEGATTPALVLGVLAGPGVAAAHVLPWSMLPDVVEVDTLERGADRTGDFYGMMTFLEQVATAVALWVLGNALGAAGYLEGAAEQGEGARLAIRLLIGPVPGVVLLVAGLYAWARPPLTREALGQAVAKLRAA